MTQPLPDPYVARATASRPGRGWKVAVVALGLALVAQATLIAVLVRDRVAAPGPRRVPAPLAPDAAAAPPAIASSAVAPSPLPGASAGPLPVELTDAERRTIEVFRRSASAVVFVTTLQVSSGPFSFNETAIPAGTGTGFLWDDQGHVVTNHHVISSGNAARVTLSDRSRHDARLVGTAPEKEIAVLRIDVPRERLQPLARGSSADLQVGQATIAIGNPFGLDHTLSTGVVSGLGREIKSLAGTPISGVVQTDAAINPGNSGGPLLDSRGRLIGINTAIFSPSGASAGIGFAVPVDTVSQIVPQLIQHGRVIRPGLGVQIADDGLVRRMGIKGVLVLGLVEGSGAADAGLEPTRRDRRTGEVILGDIIVALDGQSVQRNDDLFRALDPRKVGDVVRVRVVRGDRTLELDVRLTDVNP
jgi:S1-C subfamily serine protease